ncbi:MULTISPECIES: aromatic ring-hydroxylating oxygenase subunit alpha [Sphingobium]|uniref:aromatic ring-hydroxylating oxygenase subunit alpha n=1 Tax=Sphingobium TaxID=165695 RepID=UPI00159BF70C|nr:aromatic ring-hydroxylating dioxygenase subunit alpha [Sphingobium sp. 15-1]
MTDLNSADGDLRPVQKPISSAFHAPGWIYSCPENYKEEQKKIFHSEWLMVGREEELANPGDYKAIRIFDEPLLLSRDKDGVLRAFANVCRHRGVEVAFGTGNAKLFTCPYHGWTYRLDGTLLGASTVSENVGFDKKTCRLPSIHMNIWAGNIFVNFAKDPPPFEDFAASLEKRFGHLHLDRLRIGGKETVPQGCNWKFGVENLLDFYHVQVLHLDTLGKKFDFNGDDIQSEAGWIEASYRGAPLTPDGQSRFPRLPWLEGLGDDFATSCRIPPNMHLFARIDQVLIITIWPDSVDKCHLTAYLLFPEEVINLPNFEADVQTHIKYVHDIAAEDILAVESLQAATLSANYRGGPMVPLEKSIHDVINDYLGRMDLSTVDA